MATVKEKTEQIDIEATKDEESILTPEQRELEANNIVKNHVMVSMGLGIIPMPIVDLIGLTGTQLNMLRSLSNLYGQKFSTDLGKKSIASLAGGTLSIPIAMGLSSLVKFVPIIGQTAGVISMATTGGASTYAIGKIFIQHFEAGGTFLTFDPAKVREHFKAEFEKGKDVAKDIESKKAKA